MISSYILTLRQHCEVALLFIGNSFFDFGVAAPYSWLYLLRAFTSRYCHEAFVLIVVAWWHLCWYRYTSLFLSCKLASSVWMASNASRYLLQKKHDKLCARKMLTHRDLSGQTYGLPLPTFAFSSLRSSAFHTFSLLYKSGYFMCFPWNSLPDPTPDAFVRT